MKTEQLLSAYRKRIYKFLLKYVKVPDLAEDLTQDVLVKLWKNRQRLESVGDCEAYVLAVTRNHIRDHFHKLTREDKYRQEVWEHVQATDDSSYKEIQANELLENIEGVVVDLPLRQKQVYCLTYKQGMSLKEIAGHLKISPYTAKNHLAQALKAIRSKINPESFLIIFWSLYELYPGLDEVGL